MRMTLGLAIVAGGLLATGTTAQTMAPASPARAYGGAMMRADTNEDGAITRAEMIADAEARFVAMDTDKDGTVTAAEREAARQAMRRQREAGGAGRGAGGGFGGRGSFGGRGDADGVITRADEVRRAGARFDRLDTNRDGKLDAGELAAMRPMRGARGSGDMPPPPAPAPATPAR